MGVPLAYLVECRSRAFESYQGLGVFPWARVLIFCLVLAQPRKTSPHDLKIVDWDVKSQPIQIIELDQALL